MQMLISLVLWIIMGSLNAYFANQRGRDPIAWFMIGILLGVLGLVVLFLLPKLKNKPEDGFETLELETDPPIGGIGIGALPTNSGYRNRDWFYLDASRRQMGPIKFKALKSSLIEGKLNKESLVWAEGMDSWKKIQELPDLLDILS